MPTTKKRPSTTAAVPKTAIEQAGQLLQGLPEKPKDTWSLREAVSLLHEPISSAISRGYSHEEVATILGEKGVEITASSLKRYLAAAKREKVGATKTKTRRARKPRASKVKPEAETITAAAPAEVTPEPAAPARKRRATSKPAASTAKTAAKTRSTSRANAAPRSTAKRGRKQSDDSAK